MVIFGTFDETAIFSEMADFGKSGTFCKTAIFEEMATFGEMAIF